ncbi:MAG: hypothetical protein ACYDD1_03555 [Caulobacteraceae bacterium]
MSDKPPTIGRRSSASIAPVSCRFRDWPPFGVSHTAINNRAKRDLWSRNLAQKVREVAAHRLVSDGVSASNARKTVEASAACVVEVVCSHRRDISTGRSLVGTLLYELRRPRRAAMRSRKPSRLRPPPITAFNQEMRNSLGLTLSPVRTLATALDPLEIGRHLDKFAGGLMYKRQLNGIGSIMMPEAGQEAAFTRAQKAVPQPNKLLGALLVSGAGGSQKKP